MNSSVVLLYLAVGSPSIKAVTLRTVAIPLECPACDLGELVHNALQSAAHMVNPSTSTADTIYGMI